MFAVMDQWLSGSTEVRIPGAENGMEFLDRFGSAVKSHWNLATGVPSPSPTVPR